MSTPLQTDFLTERTAYNSDRQEEYKAWAIAGSLPDKDVWLIRKTTYTNNQKVLHQFANGTLSFNQAWDNRATLTYF